MHAGTQHLLRQFAFAHLPERLKRVSRPCHDLAHRMADELPQGPEVTAGLRKLLEAKDCFVRAAAIDSADPSPHETESSG